VQVIRRVVAALVTLVALAATAGCGLLPESRMTISAVFPDSTGLYLGNDVAVLGIKVGSVVAVHPEGTHVVVDMAVDSDVKIPADVGAVTLSPSVVTDRRVELTPVYRGGPTMRDGDRIPLDRTRTPVEIDRVFAAADRIAGQLNTVLDQGGRPALADALDVASHDFAGNGDKLRESLHGLAAAVGVGADYRDQLVQLIRDVDHLTQVSAQQDGTIRSFTGNLTEATSLLDQQGPHLVDALDNVTDLLARTDRLISDNRSKGEDTLHNLRVSANTLADHSRDLAESLDVLPTTFRNLAAIVDPQRHAARAHASIEQPILDTQLISGVCQRFGSPQMCSGSFDGRSSTAATGLAALMTGVGR
jgi:virulence factor Mce-like protein